MQTTNPHFHEYSFYTSIIKGETVERHKFRSLYR
jgi:hypothetical protein